MDSCPRARTALLAVIVALTLLQSPAPARAHWCNTLWQSGYNVVVRPEVDSLEVPASGSAALVVWVQNNMGYPLASFVLAASASGFTIPAPQLDASTRTVAGYLMPGERQKYTLDVSRNGGTTLQAADLTFAMTFGTGSQSANYGTSSYGRDAVIRLSNGDLAPTPLANLGVTGGQATHLGSAAMADYGDMQTGLDGLLNEYCVGRGHFNCSDVNYVTCPARVTRTTSSNTDWQHLWAAEFLAARKAGLATIPGRTAIFRQRLICGSADDLIGFAAMPMLLLGYLGDDDNAHTFLEGKVSSGSTAEQAVAKAALYVLGHTADRDDRAYYRSDVQAGLSSANVWIEMYSAAALGLADFNDSAVADHLIPNIAWANPECSASPCDDGVGFTAGHLLDLVTWDRRGWATGSDDTGCGGYFRGCDTTPPDSPLNVSCTPGAGGSARIQWDQVTSEPIGRYWVYWGEQARSAGCARPGTCAVDYSSSGNTGSIYFDLSGLTMGSTYYVAVSAVDAAGNFSDYSSEVSCAIPVTPEPPVASLTCTPTSGNAPLDVSCDGTASSDPNGDIAHYYFSLDGAAETDEADGLIDYPALAAGNHTVALRVADSGGRSDTASASIQVTTPGNQAPTAQISASPLSGQAPLTVSFDGSASSDPDGSIAAWDWNFADGSSHGTSAALEHVFAADGSYNVVLTVTDDGSAPLTGTAVVTIEVGGAANQPPDVSTASATPLFGPAPLTVAFDASGVRDPDGDPVTLSWDFGDSSTISHEAVTSHVYTSNGEYFAVLTAEDDQQPPNAATRQIRIAVTDNNPPDIDAATVSPLSGPFPLTVTFDATPCSDPDGDHLSYRWEVAVASTESLTSDSPTLQHTFAEPGDYDATLTLADDGNPPLVVTRRFTIDVLYPPESGQPQRIALVPGGCACAADDTAALCLALGGVLLIGLAWRRRRCR
ncbi:MAG: PKD domain-containing protein [Deltaproteobacteria bacterium]|nr:PKD domain-containing protein [Deltaproteobacteria bacterium]